MAAELPGYYFDPEKGKYFKIQPNHAVPSAAQHSKQAIEARRISMKRRKVDGELKIRHLRELVQRSRLLEHPLMNRVRLKNAIAGAHGLGSSVTTEVATYYGAGLSRMKVIGYDYPRVCIQKFAIDEVTADMIATSTGANNIVVHHTHSAQVPRRPHPHDGRVVISIVPTPATALLITPSPATYILWATSATASTPGTIRVVPFGRERNSRAAVLRFRRPGESIGVNYDDMGVSWSVPESDIWDMVASPSGRSVVAACSSGLRILEDLNHRLDKQMRKIEDREYMAVSFKGENIVLGGTRVGTVCMVDVRSSTGTCRLRHGSGVASVRALSNDNYVLVRGLEKISIYDLRYTPQSNSLSKPYMTFPGAYACDRFGLGFDYDPGLGLVATAHFSSTGPGNCISLFSTRTGKLVPSPINSHPFTAPVTCIQFTNAIRSRCADFSEDILADDGRLRENNEPKSIVTASGGRVDEWSVQGLGFENERQE